MTGLVVQAVPGHLVCNACGQLCQCRREEKGDPFFTTRCTNSHCSQSGRDYKYVVPKIELEPVVSDEEFNRIRDEDRRTFDSVDESPEDGPNERDYLQ